MRQCLVTCLELQRSVNSYAQGTYQDSPGGVSQVLSRSRSPLRRTHFSPKTPVGSTGRPDFHSIPSTPVRSPRRPGFHSVPLTPDSRNTLDSPERSPLRFSPIPSPTTSFYTISSICSPEHSDFEDEVQGQYHAPLPSAQPFNPPLPQPQSFRQVRYHQPHHDDEESDNNEEVEVNLKDIRLNFRNVRRR